MVSPKNTSVLAFSLLIIALAHNAAADWSKISADQIQISNPPAPTSREYKNDYAVLHQYQDNRKQSDCQLASTQNIPSFESLYGSSHLLSAREMSAAKPLADKAMRLAEKIATVFKNKFHRLRPFDADTTLQPCVDRPAGAKSFPSSHAAMAVAGACVLGQIYPARAVQFESYANYLAELRVIIGVHHPSDIEAGKSIAEQICDAMKADRDFQQDVSAVRP